MEPGRPGAALATDTGEPEWSTYSSALGRKFLHLDAFLKEKGIHRQEIRVARLPKRQRAFDL